MSLDQVWKSQILPQPSQQQLTAFLQQKGIKLADFEAMRPPVRVQLMRQCQQFFYGDRGQGGTNG